VLPTVSFRISTLTLDLRSFDPAHKKAFGFYTKGFFVPCEQGGLLHNSSASGMDGIIHNKPAALNIACMCPDYHSHSGAGNATSVSYPFMLSHRVSHCQVSFSR